MADNHLEFSEVLGNLTEPEEAWLKEQLQPIRVFGDHGVSWRRRARRTGRHRCRIGPVFASCVTSRTTIQNGMRWVSSTSFTTTMIREVGAATCGSTRKNAAMPDNVAWLVQKFLKKFRPDQCWSLTYATTCSKPRAGEFGGGAMFVTADEIKWQNAYDFIEEQRAAFKAKQSKAHQAKKGKTA